MASRAAVTSASPSRAAALTILCRNPSFSQGPYLGLRLNPGPGAAPIPASSAAVSPATPPLSPESPSGRKNEDTAGREEMFLSKATRVSSEQRGRAWTRKPPAAWTRPALSRDTPRARAQLT